MRARLKALLVDESGNYVAQQMVGAMLNLIVLTSIATGLIGAGMVQATIAMRSQVTSQATSTEASLSSDIKWASAITPGARIGEVDVAPAEGLALTIPGRDGKCRESTWWLRTVTGHRELVNQVVTYAEYDASVSPVRCAGAKSAPTEQVMVTRAGPEAVFTYFNSGGRAFADPGEALFVEGGEDRPEQVHQLQWESQAVATVALRTSIGTGSQLESSFHFAQGAANLDLGRRQAQLAGESTQTHFMDHGSLTGGI